MPCGRPAPWNFQRIPGSSQHDTKCRVGTRLCQVAFEEDSDFEISQSEFDSLSLGLLLLVLYIYPGVA